MNKTLYWIPRILTILFILFISLFALDSFEENQSFLANFGGFLIHLIPGAILMAILIFSWRYEIIGALAFLFLGIAYIILAWGKFPLATYLIISGPLVVISVMFWLNWRNRGKSF